MLIYDDFRAENEATVRRVLRFLDVDDTVEIEAVEANPTVAVRSLRLNNAVSALYEGRGPVGRAVSQTVKAVTPTRLRRGAYRAFRSRLVYGKPPAPDRDAMAQLRHRFRDEVVSLSEYMERDLVTLWGYDSID